MNLVILNEVQSVDDIQHVPQFLIWKYGRNDVACFSSSKQYQLKMFTE